MNAADIIVSTFGAPLSFPIRGKPLDPRMKWGECIADCVGVRATAAAKNGLKTALENANKTVGRVTVEALIPAAMIASVKEAPVVPVDDNRRVKSK